MSAEDLNEARRQLKMASSALSQLGTGSEVMNMVDARIRIADCFLEIHTEDDSEVDGDDAEDLGALPSTEEVRQREQEPILPGFDRGIQCKTGYPHVGHWIYCSGIG